MCFSTFLAQPLQCMDTLSITILGFNWKAKVWFPATTSFNLSNWLLSLAINGLLSNSSWVSKVFMQKQELEQEERLKQSSTLPKLSFPILNYKSTSFHPLRQIWNLTESTSPHKKLTIFPPKLPNQPTNSVMWSPRFQGKL